MRLFVSNFLMFLLLLLMFSQPVEASDYPRYVSDKEVCSVAARRYEDKFQIKKHLLNTITNVETGKWDEVSKKKTAWPWTINAQGKGYFFDSKREAIAAVKRLQAEGIRSIDVGCMQINLVYHPDAFKNLEEAFNPYKNVEYGAKFVKKLYVQKGRDWNKAAAAYHSSLPEKANIYAQKLSEVYRGILQGRITSKTVDKSLIGTKKLEKTIRFAKNKSNLKSKLAVSANAWREAKLAEYHLRKAERL